MADGTDNTATQPEGGNAPAVQPVSGGQQQYAPPAGHRLIPDSDYERFTRAEQQARGSEAFFKKIQGYGFKNPDDLDKYGDVFKFGKPDVLSQILKGGGDAGGETESAGGAGVDPAKLKAEIMADIKRQSAEEEWQRGYEGHGKLVDKYLAGLEDADESEKEVWRNALLGKLEQGRSELKWPDGHPLASDRLPVFDEESSKSVFEWATKTRQALRGSQMAKIGEAANRQPPQSTPAGKAGGQGKPTDNEGSNRTSAGIKSIVDRAVAEAGVE